MWGATYISYHKKHPLQNRTNVQIKGRGGQRPFEQCSKKLHFFETKASLSLVMLWRWGQVFFVRFTLFHDSAFKLITFILTVNFAITAGFKADTVSVVACVLVKTARAEAHPLDFSPSREAAEVISDKFSNKSLSDFVFIFSTKQQL